ncbi:CRISPR system precrRNA processing endoribonuclease RAMP protein Cas6 [Pseudonocardia alni]|uniref:CRISPR system precrRNA processing endoribonuclease RAMP protein Cas6 n=1 Tax=Pseudonocardia alni TaxID=33907 RepID=UPI0033F688C4
MPATVDIRLAAGDRDLDVTPVRLHGAGCALFGHPAPGAAPGFSTGPLVDHGDVVWWRLGWLGAARCPTPTGSVRIGPATRRIVGADVAEWSFAQLAAGPPARAAEVDVLSPLYFSRSGRDHPLPDPVLVVGSLARRWNQWCPVESSLTEDELRALTSSVHLTDLDGRTRTSPVRPGQDQTGFVGRVRFAVPRAAGATTAAAFAALLRFAEIAGVGAQTGHGFGAVRVRLDPR